MNQPGRVTALALTIATHLLMAACSAGSGADSPDEPESVDLGATATGGRCSVNANCNDGNPCTTDKCVGRKCVFMSDADGTSCNDGNACTQNDVCQRGKCTAGQTVVCPAPNQCQTATGCNRSTGSCAYRAKSGGACDDGNTCTKNDKCTSAVGGVCRGTPLADGSSCDDGNPATRGDVCSSGVCGGSDRCAGVQCFPSDVCHVAGVCDPSTGACTNPPVPDGTLCDDHSACTTDDACESGTCKGIAVSIDDGNPCTVDTCDATAGARHTPRPAGTPCSDGNLCNGLEFCDIAAVCAPGYPAGGSTSDGNSCTADACDPTLGATHTQMPDGTTCNDPLSCRSGQCTNGTCLTTGPAVLDDNNPCTVDACFDDAGTAVHIALTGDDCSGALHGCVPYPNNDPVSVWRGLTSCNGALYAARESVQPDDPGGSSSLATYRTCVQQLFCSQVAAVSDARVAAWSAPSELQHSSVCFDDTVANKMHDCEEQNDARVNACFVAAGFSGANGFNTLASSLRNIANGASILPLGILTTCLLMTANELQACYARAVRDAPHCDTSACCAPVNNHTSAGHICYDKVDPNNRVHYTCSHNEQGVPIVLPVRTYAKESCINQVCMQTGYWCDDNSAGGPPTCVQTPCGDCSDCTYDGQSNCSAP